MLTYMTKQPFFHQYTGGKIMCNGRQCHRLFACEQTKYMTQLTIPGGGPLRYALYHMLEQKVILIGLFFQADVPQGALGRKGYKIGQIHKIGYFTWENMVNRAIFRKPKKYYDFPIKKCVYFPYQM